jgi:hypothetical protein
LNPLASEQLALLSRADSPGRAIRIERSIPAKLESLANVRGTWRAAKISKAARDRVETAWPAGGRGILLGADPANYIVSVTLVRYTTNRSPGLDDDNLRGAFKPVRDEITRQLGLKSDKASPSLSWLYDERKSEAGWSFGFVVGVVAIIELLPREIPPRATKRKRAGPAAFATPNTFPPVRRHPWTK